MLTSIALFLRNENVAKLLLRLSVGGLMLPHGIFKMMNGLDGIKNMLSGRHLPEFISYGVILGEVVAPVLLILGLWSRIAGAVVFFNMLMTFVLALGLSAFTLNDHGSLNGELNWLYLFASAAICFLGSGMYSVSRGRGKWD